MLADRRVKIVATVGPASNSREVLKQLIESGVNVFRLNFSHGTHEDHLKVLQMVRSLSQELHAPVTVLQDLQGPKIRIGKLKSSIELKEGSEVILNPDITEADNLKLPVDYKKLPEFCKPGMKVLLDDGLIEMTVLQVKGRDVHCRVIFGGELKERKGVNVPGAHFDIPCLTEKDLKDLEFGIKNQVDYIALSFVRHENDIIELRKILEKNNADIRICSKIEMLEALERLEQIVSKSDAVMVARGDLAVEVGQTQLPQIQKHLIDLCNRMAKPVITATQMLESMTKNPRPTRAEVTDIANAVLDGSDALMLSAESASGKYPVIAVKTMHEVISEVEKSIQHYYQMNLDQEFLSVAEGIAASACVTALKLNAKAIVCLTTSGKTARMISAYRPRSMLIAATHKPDVLNKLEIIWGLQTIVLNPYSTSDEVLEQIEKILLSFDLVEQGDIIVLTLGVPVADRGTTNSLRVYTIKGQSKAQASHSMPLRFREGNT